VDENLSCLGDQALTSLIDCSVSSQRAGMLIRVLPVNTGNGQATVRLPTTSAMDELPAGAIPWPRADRDVGRRKMGRTSIAHHQECKGEQSATLADLKSNAPGLDWSLPERRRPGETAMFIMAARAIKGLSALSELAAPKPGRNGCLPTISRIPPPPAGLL